MTKHHTILFSAIAIFTVITTTLLVYQFRRALHITTQIETAPLVSDAFYPITTSNDDPTLGNPGADIEIIEFVDLGDTASKKLNTSLITFTRAHSKKVRVIWKDFPKQSIFLGNNNTAHLAAWCAFKQNKFWEYVDKLMADSGNLKPKGLENVANDIKLNIPAWQQCVASPEASAHIKNNITVGQAAGLSGAPGLFVNNKKIDAEQVDVDQMLNSLITE